MVSAGDRAPDYLCMEDVDEDVVTLEDEASPRKIVCVCLLIAYVRCGRRARLVTILGGMLRAVERVVRVTGRCMHLARSETALCQANVLVRD
jgi:hypothetical protein